MTRPLSPNQHQASRMLATGWVRSALTPELGSCYTDRLLLEPGLSIAYSHYQPTCDLVESSVIEQNTCTLSITFGLTGQSCYRPKRLNHDEFVFEPHHSTLTTFGHSEGERLYRAGEEVNQLRIIVDGSLFERYQIPFQVSANAIRAPQKHQHIHLSKSTEHMVQRLLLLSQSSQTERPLEKHILVLNLLSEQLTMLPTQVNTQSLRSRQLDEANIVKAKQFMLQNLDQPLSLSYIAHNIGVSETKLQTGFKKLFGQSPYKVLLEARMQRAWELLNSGYQVAQAAYAVGYEHPSNFSTAFRQFYGCSPKSVAHKPCH